MAIVLKRSQADPYFVETLCYALNMKGVQKYLESGELTVRLLVSAADTDSFMSALDKEIIQTYLGDNKLTITQLAHLTDIPEFTKALSHDLVFKYINKRWMSIEQLINTQSVTKFVKALEASRKIDLASDQYIQKLINLPDILAFNPGIAHPEVRFIERKQLPLLKLVTLPNLNQLSRALYNKNVHNLLLNGKLSLLQLINLRNISAFVDALSHQHVRAALKKGAATLEQLIQDTEYYDVFPNSLFAMPTVQGLQQMFIHLLAS
ncbi:MAG: hypothetical protein K0R08_796 [Solimicrobium sp.]|jgi:hypothetical protein|nr:hypothetical protein [Solimicrobium sp.]